MGEEKYTPFYTLSQRIASSRPGVWIFSRILHHLDLVSFKLGVRRPLSSLLSGLPVIEVTTIGAKSGLPRTLPLVAIRDPDSPGAFALIASNWGQSRHPAWYYNLKANPRAACAVDGRMAEYRAHEASGEEYQRFWSLATDTYFGYSLYKQRTGGRRIPIMVVEIVE